MTTQSPAALKLSTPNEREIHTERIFNAPRERVWKALSDPKVLAQWWGRGNKVVVERHEFERGGHWRFVEHASDGTYGFKGRFRKVTPIERIVQSFEWDGMPAHVIIETTTLEDLGDGRTKLSTVSQFHTTDERDGFLQTNMEEGLSLSYAMLDKVLASLA